MITKEQIRRALVWLDEIDTETPGSSDKVIALTGVVHLLELFDE